MYPASLPPGYAAEMDALETDTLVRFHRIFEEDASLRRRYGIRPRSNRGSLRCELNRRKINRQLTPGGFLLWDLEHYRDKLIPIYENNSHACARRSRASVACSYMTATPEILSSPNWLPRSEAARAAGIRPDRIISMNQSMKILPRWDFSRRRLLYPVDQIREHAAWRPLHFIVRHCTPEQCLAIRLTRQKKPMFPFGTFNGFLYHVPELSHL